MGLKAAGIPAVMIPDLIPYEDSLEELVTYRLASLWELCPGGQAEREGPEA